MKLSRLKLSIISLFLGESQIQAQTLKSEGSTVGVQPYVNRFEEEVLVDPFAPSEDRLETREFKAIHSSGYRQSQGELGQIFDSAAISSIDRDSKRLDQRSLSWNLGLSSDYSATAGTSLLSERLVGAHRFTLSLSGLGRLYKGNGASLEEIYTGASRLSQDFSSYDPAATQRSEVSVRAADSIRVGTQSSLSLNGEFHQDHYVIDDALNDGSIYEAGSLYSRIGMGVNRSVETLVKRSLVLYRDHRNNLSQGQDLNEGEIQMIQPIAARYLIGFGAKFFDGHRNGPMLSLIRKTDERASGQLKLVYLSGDEYSQFLSSLRSQYFWTRKLKMILNLEQGVDLLASYGSNTTTNQTRDREQRLSRAYDLTWTLTEKKSSYSLALVSNQQDYASAQFSQQQVRFELDHEINPLDKLIVSAALRHNTETGEVNLPINRRYASLASDWRHYWGLDSRLFGARSFGQIGLSYERLWEGEREPERKTFSMALGQEWL